jgi:hypothetical protein
MRVSLLVACLMAASLAAAPHVATQPADLDVLLDKTIDYVVAYERDFVGVVAEETYRQEFRGRRGTDARGFPTDAVRQTRDLKSDVLLVRAPAGDRWMQFRDVFEVDGKPVRDRAERLARLFLQPSPSAQKQVEDITSESARYNIGGVNRNVNLPVLALAALEPANRPWFSFSGSRKRDSPEGGVWELEFREERTGTLIRTTGDQSMPARGRFSIEGGTGRILSSQLVAESRALRAQIDVSYGLDPAVGLFVPREMREKYATKDGATIEGRATYARFRRYKVTVDERVAAAEGEEPTLDAVLVRAGGYSVGLQEQLAGVVAEEQYTLDVRARPAPSATPALIAGAHRVLTSDLLLVKPDGADRWFQFRDVFEVDGRHVRGRDDRLIALFLEPSSSTAIQADRIRGESARYNVGTVEPNINVPLLALLVLDPKNQSRFSFARTRDATPELEVSVGPATAWVVQFEEVRPLTLVRTARDRDLPLRGRFWIEAATGRVLMSELVARDPAFRAVAVVRYEMEPQLGLAAPAEMREEYVDLPSGEHTEGTATYGAFRRFQVLVDARFAPIRK